MRCDLHVSVKGNERSGIPIDRDSIDLGIGHAYRLYCNGVTINFPLSGCEKGTFEGQDTVTIIACPLGKEDQLSTPIKYGAYLISLGFAPRALPGVGTVSANRASLFRMGQSLTSAQEMKVPLITEPRTGIST